MLDNENTSNQTIVEIETPQKLSATQLKSLQNYLKHIFGKNPFSVHIKINPSLIGGLSLHVNSVLIDDTIQGKLNQFQRNIFKTLSQNVDVAEVSHFLATEIDQFDKHPIVQEIGLVLSVTDGIVQADGLKNITSGEQVLFEGGQYGFVLNLNKETVDIVVLDNAEHICEGQKIFRIFNHNTVPVGVQLLGRAINPLGQPIDGGDDFDGLPQRPIQTDAPGIVDRQKVFCPILTGIKGIDALVPIGRGQRELIIGDRQTGKTSVILDMILAQKKINEQAQNPKEKMFCIYVAIGQKQSAIRHIMQVLQQYGALEYTVIVSATASDSASMQYLAPYAGCTIGEYFRDNGMHAVVFYDDLSKHAIAYREMSLLLKRPVGREAYPADVFYLHARLLERSAQLNQQNGGGSLTAIPVIETQEGDVSAYIPTNVISITDGQIFLEGDLFNQGIRPALNVGLSVSRVGSAAQTKAMKKIAGSLKLDLAQYREILSFSQFSSDLEPTTQALLNKGAHLTKMMTQDKYHPMTMAEEVISLFAGVHGYLDTVPLAEVSLYESVLQEKIKTEGAHILHSIEQEQDISDEIQRQLHAFLTELTRDFLEKGNQVS